MRLRHSHEEQVGAVSLLQHLVEDWGLEIDAWLKYRSRQASMTVLYSSVAIEVL